MIQEVGEVEYRGIQLEGQGIQEMQHPPVEMWGQSFHPTERERSHAVAMTQQRW